ncbi:hypothetical protein KSX_48280 [Ktedonospora formicarum]|uniref:Uncharacterized protein n=1 Tax=Ktedonospora formicarum TaxID=2778364 RepID=A0A8J3I4T9_9CHLR|nr:hypothetical protein KSX_48280 [Ktedonospora formicarum]
MEGQFTATGGEMEERSLFCGEQNRSCSVNSAKRMLRGPQLCYNTHVFIRKGAKQGWFNWFR